MATFEIKHQHTDAVLHRGEFESLLKAVEDAVAKKVNLRGANLYGAALYGANLYGADLYGADLHYANLHGADLHGADLRVANLYYANLYGANLYGANLHYADLRGAKGITVERTSPLGGMKYLPGDAIQYAFKLVKPDFTGPYNGGISYTPGMSPEVKDADTSDKQCAAGINVATLDWCLRAWERGYKVMLVSFSRDDIASIPLGTDGKFRLHRCTVLHEVDLDFAKLCPQEP